MKNTDPFDFSDMGELDFNIDMDVDVDDSGSDDSPVTGRQVNESFSKLLSDFKQKAVYEKKRMDLVLDSEYWFCVCFQTREEKESFLKNAKLIDVGDKYLDGHVVAKKLNVNFEKTVFEFPKTKKNRNLADL